MECRDLASRLDVSTVVGESVGAYFTRQEESFPFRAELETLLDQVKKSRLVTSRLERYVLELGAEFKEAKDHRAEWLSTQPVSCL